MTGLYAWNPMPHVLDVRCPACGDAARFEFAEARRIERRVDIAFFQDSDQFVYHLCANEWGQQKGHLAFYHALLHGRPETAIRDLPEGYSASDWQHSRYLYRRHGHDEGAVACTACGFRRRHVLAWPADAWFRIDYRGRTLWAFDRRTALLLREYVAAKQRHQRDFPQGFLRHVPSHFLTSNARSTVVKLLDRLLTD